MCLRLLVKCQGAGNVRYKFLPGFMSDSKPKEDGITTNPLAIVPANDTTNVIKAFIWRLEVTDVRYDVSSYGMFLKKLPQRATVNPALAGRVLMD
ncbi:hypothetical protein HJFPF1_08356 [Paramyrothecium foliicola]|nr:hypothetical protein HJFPF1_08356 [Paramyrothecium foliicola]